MNALTISNLHVAINETEILRGLSLTVKPGEVHAVMGPNGSGKSTLAYSLAGHPSYQVTAGSVKLGKENILDLAPDERAQRGLFLAFQYPVEIPGVKVYTFLRQAYQARFADQAAKQFPTVLSFRNYVDELATKLNVKKTLLNRGLNEGFSGGEKKRLEILQMAVLEPSIAVLDETDSGLDIDAIKAVAAGVHQVADQHKTGIIVITHYQRILEYLKPDFVHVVVEGRVVQSGGKEVVAQLEKTGYKEFTTLAE